MDADGNRSSAVSRSWSVDTSAPGTTLDSAPSGRSRSNVGRFRFSSTRAGATFECKLDRGAWTACESPYETTAVADGTHTLRVRAVIGTSPKVYDPTPIERQWTVKTTAPETTLISAPSGTQELQSATFQFRSNERLATFQCKLDAGDYYACASPALVTKLAEGAHTLYIRAVDPFGNRDESPIQVDWTVKPNEDDGGGPVTGSTIATLTQGGLVFPGLSDSIALPAQSLVITGDVSNAGEWSVAANGIQFPQITQAVTAGGLNIVAKISISAVGAATGSLPKNGGPASISFPAQLKVVVESDTGAVLIGPGAGCFLRPIQFNLTGNYDAATKELTLGQNNVLFPKTSAGCGALGSTVDSALGLPRNDVSISVRFDVNQAAALPVARSLPAGSLLNVPVSCPKANACSGSVTVTTRGGKRITIGAGKFGLKRGARGLVPIKLPKSVLDAVSKAGTK
ncbi:MAG: hypothetical protein KGR17_10285, partial [Acidobacteria bacterium]|nr:hypothetical protein [Acidobacteriota bacterium]